MTTYAPNPFQAQGAQADALRSYAPNPFAGKIPGGAASPGGVTSMAPHLSVGAADRPYAKEISQLQGAGFQLPDLDAAWRQSPKGYEYQVSQLLRGPNASMALLVDQAHRDDEAERLRQQQSRPPAYEGE